VDSRKEQVFQKTMKGHSSVYRLHIFTLRLWLEQLDNEVFEWRGEIKNTSTGEIRYFRSERSLYNALWILLDMPSPAARHDAGTDG
jgi:hypothetical protein